MKSTVVAASLLVAIAASNQANARIGMEKQGEYERQAFLAGACGDGVHLQALEIIYDMCDASDGQWDAMHSEFKNGSGKKEQCDNSLEHLRKMREIYAMSESLLGEVPCQ